MIISTLLALFALQAPSGFANLDFEDGTIGGPPSGWSAGMPGYRVYLDKENPKQGKFCGIIEKEKTNPSSSFGSLRQFVRAKQYRGKRLVFRSFVRTEPEISGNKACLFIAAYRSNRERIFYENNDYAVIRTSQWKVCEISAEIPLDAETIDFGLILEGDGRAFWDDIELAVLDPAQLGDEAPRPLEGQSLGNVVAFCRLMGYLRFFYPGDETLHAVNWEAFTIDGIRFVESARNAEELSQRLIDWCLPIAPAVRIFPLSQAEKERKNFSIPKVDATGFVYWKHQGVSLEGEASGGFSSRRVHVVFQNKEKIEEGAPSPEKPFFAELGGGVGCIVPLALYFSNLTTLPANTKPQLRTAPPRNASFYPSGNDRATRLANVALVWNVLQHFYPYFDFVLVDWPAVLPKVLQTAATDRDEFSFFETLQRMMAQIKDGHGWTTFAKDKAIFVPPIALGWIEGNAVVTGLIPGLVDGIEIGDVVTVIDSRDIRKALADREPLVPSATPQWLRHRVLELILRGEKGSKLSLGLKKQDGSVKNLELLRSLSVHSEQFAELQTVRRERMATLEPGIVYIDLTRASTEDFNSFLPAMERAHGIIFDLRGYPRVSLYFLAHLFEQPFSFAKAYAPIAFYPDRIGQHFTGDLNPSLDPQKPFLKAHKVFLTNEKAISQAESDLMVVEGYKLGEIVGSPTAGANGNINTLKLPGGYSVTWSGMRMLKHDGSRHQGIGVQPTVTVSPTIQGSIDGRDEVFEKALELLRQGKRH